MISRVIYYLAVIGTNRLHRVTAAIGPETPASIAAAERHGFTRKGVRRDDVFTNEAWRGSVLYSALAHEWQPAGV